MADNGLSLAADALDGVGIVYLPEELINHHMNSGALVPIMADYLIRPAGTFVVRPPGQYLTRKVKILTEILIECLGKTNDGKYASVGS